MDLTAAPPTLEKRVWALESELLKLSRQVEANRKQAANDMARARRTQSDRVAELEKDRQRREEAEKKFLWESVALQWWGIRLFVIGAICSAAANLAN